MTAYESAPDRYNEVLGTYRSGFNQTVEIGC